jgi:hypothetical protein
MRKRKRIRMRMKDRKKDEKFPHLQPINTRVSG